MFWVLITQIPTLVRKVLKPKNLRKIGIFIISLVLFIVALEYMKAGAADLAPVITDLLSISNPTNGLGFGWFSSYLVMSGSPIAASALTFLDVNAIDARTAFAMITGSRLGASTIVLIIGLLYILRGAERGTSLVTGVVALLVTMSVYLPALPFGLFLVGSPLLGDIDVSPMEGGGGQSIISQVLSFPVELTGRFLPSWMIFIIGLGLIIFSLNLFDKAIPEFNLESTVFAGINRLLYRPPFVFALGFGLTLVTMSVSVSLGLLVPLSVRGYVRRENLIPYIMGCNVSTFIDTLIAGLLLGNPTAASVVLIQMLSVTLISAIILVLFYTPYERNLLRIALWLNGQRERLAVFFAAMVLIPLGLLLLW